MGSSRKQRSGFVFAAILALLWFAPLSVHAENPKDILIIVNISVPVDAIAKEQIKNLFLRKQTFWPRSGGRVVPVHAKSGTQLREDFLRRGLDMTIAEEDSYWRARQIQKGVTRPPEFSNPLKAVHNLKRSVSYIYRSDFKANLAKIVFVLAHPSP